MQRFLLFIPLLLTILFSNTLFAQQQPEQFNASTSQQQAYTFSFGPTIGIGLAFPSSPDGYDFTLHQGLAYRVGASANFHFGQRSESSPSGTGLIGIALELAYSGRMIGSTMGKIGLHCIEVPILAQFYPLESLAKEFYLEAGLTVAKTIKCTPEQIQYENMILSTGKLKSSDIMVAIGAQYKIKKQVAVGIRYHLGTSPLADNFNSKVSNLTLSATYLIK